MLLLRDFRSSCFLSIGQHGQLHTSAVLQLAGIRFNPMHPHAYNVFRSGGSWRFDPGPFGDEALMGPRNDTRIPNPDGIRWPHNSRMFQGQYLAVL